MTLEEAIGSNPGTITQETRAQKRSWSSTKSTARLDTGSPQKRPRRTTKGTRGSGCQAVSCIISYILHKTGTYRVPCPRCWCRGQQGGRHRRRLRGRVWLPPVPGLVEPSLIAIKNLVGRELRRRCEELFGKRYGHQGLRRRTSAMKWQAKKN